MSPTTLLTAPVVLRPATADDQPRLLRLAALDSRPAPRRPMVVAEVDGALLAAVPADGVGPAVSDPFVPTAELVAILRTFARRGARTA
ncbi:MAG TPA: hypothetical protein VIL49_01915 [Capillimicrobium sp.]|jgi:hypothetical protein